MPGLKCKLFEPNIYLLLYYEGIYDSVNYNYKKLGRKLTAHDSVE